MQIMGGQGSENQLRAERWKKGLQGGSSEERNGPELRPAMRISRNLRFRFPAGTGFSPPNRALLGAQSKGRSCSSSVGIW